MDAETPTPVPDLSAWTTSQLLAAYEAPAPWVRTNMVVSLDGHYVDLSGGSSDLGSADDLRIMHILRALSDVVLVGGHTLRHERYIPGAISAECASAGLTGPRIAAVSATLDLPSHNPIFTGTHRPIVLTQASSSHHWKTNFERLSPQCDIRVSSSALSGEWIIQELAASGLVSVLCEGGPAIVDLLRAGGCVNELCVTVAPVVVGRPHDRSAFGNVHANLHTTFVARAGDHVMMRLQTDLG